MVHEHDHSHDYGGHHHHDGSRRRLLFSFLITLGFMVVEAAGGLLTNSLALLSDAGHMLTDAGALGLSLLAFKIGDKPPSVTKTFGYRRLEILAALLNGLALWGIVGIILHEAYNRLEAPPEIRAGGMIVVAGLGLAVNLISLKLLHSHKDENLNIRGAFLHIIADSLGSVGALGAGLLIMFTGLRIADPLVSLAICLLILWSSWGLVRDSVHVLLLGVPPHISYRAVEAALLAQPDVCCLYDLHIFSIASGREAMSVHVVVPDRYTRQKELLREITDDLKERFGIEHVTIQIEESHEMLNSRGDSVCKIGRGKSACTLKGDDRGQRTVDGNTTNR